MSRKSFKEHLPGCVCVLPALVLFISVAQVGWQVYIQLLSCLLSSSSLRWVEALLSARLGSVESLMLACPAICLTRCVVARMFVVCWLLTVVCFRLLRPELVHLSGRCGARGRILLHNMKPLWQYVAAQADFAAL